MYLALGNMLVRLSSVIINYLYLTFTCLYTLVYPHTFTCTCIVYRFNNYWLYTDLLTFVLIKNKPLVIVNVSLILFWVWSLEFTSLIYLAILPGGEYTLGALLFFTGVFLYVVQLSCASPVLSTHSDRGKKGRRLAVDRRWLNLKLLFSS